MTGHVVDRLFCARLQGKELLTARRALVQLAYGRLELRRGELVATGIEAPADSDFDDDELLAFVAVAVTQIDRLQCTREAFDDWAKHANGPSSKAIMLRLCVFTWPRRWPGSRRCRTGPLRWSDRYVNGRRQEHFGRTFIEQISGPVRYLRLPCFS